MGAGLWPFCCGLGLLGHLPLGDRYRDTFGHLERPRSRQEQPGCGAPQAEQAPVSPHHVPHPPLGIVVLQRWGCCSLQLGDPGFWDTGCSVPSPKRQGLLSTALPRSGVCRGGGNSPAGTCVSWVHCFEELQCRAVLMSCALH